MTRISLFVAFLLSAVFFAGDAGDLLADVKEEGTIAIPVGAAVRVQMKSKKDIKQVFGERPNVVLTDPDAANATFVILRGTQQGVSRIELTDMDGSIENYTVVVQTPQAHQIRENLRANYAAYSVLLPREHAVSGFVSPRDYVAIYLTRKTAQSDQKSRLLGDRDQKTRLLLKNIRILATGGDESQPTCLVVLEVTHEEAKKLADAQLVGVLSLGLQASADTADEKLLKDRKGDSEK